MNYSQYLSELYRPPLSKNTRSEFICLDKNEPPFSAFETVNFAITHDDLKSLRIYPDPYELYEKLAKFSNVDINQLLITQGSEQAIEFIFRIFLEENDEVIYLNPSFAMFDVFAYQRKAKIKHVEFDATMLLPVNTIINTITNHTKLFVLANPNNPTGTAFTLEELSELAIHTQKTGTVFLLDEAYFHFFDIDSLSLINSYSHIIITRTFSKAFGIAGARVGYALSTKENIELLRKLKPIDEINQLSLLVANKVLDNADQILEVNISQVKKWKELFARSNLPSATYVETEGNFILIKSKSYNLHKELLCVHHILPKMDFTHDFLRDCFRFSIANNEIMDVILNIFLEN